ncbi:IS110 family transposase [Wukongibacter sp. M2B1]
MKWMLLLKFVLGVIFIRYFDFLSVGIDVASKVSWAVILGPDHKLASNFIRIDHSCLDSLNYLVNAVKKAEEVNSLKAKIFLESTGIYHIPLFCHLKEAGFEVYILNPLITDSNKNQGIRKVKSDKNDAKRIAKTAYTHDLKVSLIPADLMLNIRALTRDYHRMVDTRTVFLNQLTKELALVFPGYSSVFSNTVGKTSRAILRTFKTPKMILKVPKYKVIEFISSHAKRGKEAAEKSYKKLINAAKIAITFSHQLDASYYLIDSKLDMIETIEKRLTDIENKIKSYLDKYKNEDFVKQIKLIESITGIGFITSVTLMAEIGDFKAFRKPKQLVAYFGVDPCVKESGNFKGTKISMSKRGSSIARRVLFVVAVAAIRRNNKGEAINPVLREYYEKKLISKSKKSALGAIMRKMTNIIFAVLRDNKEYEIRTPKEHIKKYNKKLLKIVA